MAQLKGSAYRPIQIHETQMGVKMDDTTAGIWKMNCVAVSSDGLFLFVAREDRIAAYPIRGSKVVYQSPFSLPTNFHGVLINQIKTGFIGEIPVLVGVDDNGDVMVYDTRNIRKAPITLNNDGSSTWGLTIHGPSKKLAVSANSHHITIWQFYESRDEVPPGNVLSQSFPESAIFHGVSKISFLAHGNNIPCVDFSPCGNYLASASIDTHYSIWNLKGTPVLHKKVNPKNEWCWSVTWLRKSSVLCLENTDTLWKYLGSIQESFHSAVSTSLIPLPMRISDQPYRNHVDSLQVSFSSTSSENGGEPEEDIDKQSDGYEVGAVSGDDAEGFYETDGSFSDELDEEPDEQDEYYDAQDSHSQVEENLPTDSTNNAVTQNSGVVREYQEWGNKSSDVDRVGAKNQHNVIDFIGEQEEKVHESYYILGFDRSGADIMETNMNILYSSRKLIPQPFHAHEIFRSYLQGMDRLSIVFYVPEFSMVICSSQGSGKVLLCRIVKKPKDSSSISLVPEALLPNTQTKSCVVGMAVHGPAEKSTSYGDDCVVLFLYLQNHRLITYELRQIDST